MMNEAEAREMLSRPITSYAPVDRHLCFQAKGYLEAIEKASKPIEAAKTYVRDFIQLKLDHGTRSNALSKQYMALIDALAKWKKEKLKNLYAASFAFVK